MSDHPQLPQIPPPPKPTRRYALQQLIRYGSGATAGILALADYEKPTLKKMLPLKQAVAQADSFGGPIDPP